MSELVINGPICGINGCGAPRGQCNCRAVANAADPLGLSQEAAMRSYKLGHNRATNHGLNALAAAHSGDAKGAESFHLKAARLHTKLAAKAEEEGDGRAKNSHKKAAWAHATAAAAHATSPESFDSPDQDDDADQDDDVTENSRYDDVLPDPPPLVNAKAAGSNADWIDYDHHPYNSDTDDQYGDPPPTYSSLSALLAGMTEDDLDEENQRRLQMDGDERDLDDVPTGTRGAGTGTMMPTGDRLPSVYDEPPDNSSARMSSKLTRGKVGGRPQGSQDAYSPPLRQRPLGEPDYSTTRNSYPLGGEFSRYFPPPVQNAIGDSDDILPEPRTLERLIVQNQRESERQVIRQRLRVAERTKRAVLGSRDRGGLTTNAANDQHPWAGRDDLAMID